MNERHSTGILHIASRSPPPYIDRMSILVFLLLFAFLFLLSVSLVLFVIGPVMLLQPYRRTFAYYRKHTSVLHPSDLQLPYEELALKTAEGIPLSCWLIRAPEHSRGTIIYLHGVSESKIAALPMAKLLHDTGFHVFLYDARRHGQSGGTFCTYGFYEKHDASMIVTYLSNRHDLRLGKIGLFGASMGAAVALQVATIDPRITAVVAESSFATLRGVFDDYQKRMIKLPWHYLRNLVIKRSELMAHFKAGMVSPVEAVKNLHIPLFLVHGANDTLIPPASSEEVFTSANPPKELWIIPGARHDNMWEVGGEEYRGRIVAFFEKYLAA
jgi:alpha-beta hydrolase superfamily lysophospholipase